MDRGWTVRRAATYDVPAIMAVAAAAWRDTYSGLLSSGTIEAFIEWAYSRERVESRVTEDHFYVAEGAEGIVAFVDALERDDRLELLAIYTLPKVRGHGAGTALLGKLLELFPGRDISADVVETTARARSSTNAEALRLENVWKRCCSARPLLNDDGGGPLTRQAHLKDGEAARLERYDLMTHTMRYSARACHRRNPAPRPGGATVLVDGLGRSRRGE